MIKSNETLEMNFFHKNFVRILRLPFQRHSFRYIHNRRSDKKRISMKKTLFNFHLFSSIQYSNCPTKRQCRSKWIHSMNILFNYSSLLQVYIDIWSDDYWTDKEIESIQWESHSNILLSSKEISVDYHYHRREDFP